jgi:hypothetical protein
MRAVVPHLERVMKSLLDVWRTLKNSPGQLNID